MDLRDEEASSEIAVTSTSSSKAIPPRYDVAISAVTQILSMLSTDAMEFLARHTGPDTGSISSPESETNGSDEANDSSESEDAFEPALKK